MTKKQHDAILGGIANANAEGHHVHHRLLPRVLHIQERDGVASAACARCRRSVIVTSEGKAFGSALSTNCVP